MVLGDGAGELLALKRIGSVGSEQRTTLHFSAAPSAGCTERLCVYFVCDALLGVEERLPFTVKTDPSGAGSNGP